MVDTILIDVKSSFFYLMFLVCFLMMLLLLLDVLLFVLIIEFLSCLFDLLFNYLFDFIVSSCLFIIDEESGVQGKQLTPSSQLSLSFIFFLFLNFFLFFIRLFFLSSIFLPLQKHLIGDEWAFISNNLLDLFSALFLAISKFLYSSILA